MQDYSDKVPDQILLWPQRAIHTSNQLQAFKSESEASTSKQTWPGGLGPGPSLTGPGALSNLTLTFPHGPSYEPGSMAPLLPLGFPPFPPFPLPLPVTIAHPPSVINVEGLADGQPVSDIAAQWQAILMVSQQMRLQQEGSNLSFVQTNPLQFDPPHSNHAQRPDSIGPIINIESGHRSQRKENKLHECFIFESSEGVETGSGMDDDTYIDELEEQQKAKGDCPPKGSIDGQGREKGVAPQPSAPPHRRKPNKTTGKICNNCFTNKSVFWRKNRYDGLPLCNACGLFSSKNEAPRPLSLLKDEELPGILAGLISVKGDDAWHDADFLHYWSRAANKQGSEDLPTPPFPMTHPFPAAFDLQ